MCTLLLLDTDLFEGLLRSHQLGVALENGILLCSNLHAPRMHAIDGEEGLASEKRLEG